MAIKIFIMTRLPHAGLNKKRLSKDIGNVKVKNLLLKNLENCKKIFLKKKNWTLYYYLDKKEIFRSFSFSYYKNIITQHGQDLGKKMWNLKNKFNDEVILFGSDIPNINFSAIKLASNILKNNEIVIGPSFDGGFWLIGFANKKKIGYPFHDIRWSTKHALKDLELNLNKSRISFKFTEKLRDIDILEDYCDYEGRF